jgi:hypothetical protein
VETPIFARSELAAANAELALLECFDDDLVAGAQPGFVERGDGDRHLVFRGDPWHNLFRSSKGWISRANTNRTGPCPFPVEPSERPRYSFRDPELTPVGRVMGTNSGFTHAYWLGLAHGAHDSFSRVPSPREGLRGDLSCSARRTIRTWQCRSQLTGQGTARRMQHLYQGVADRIRHARELRAATPREHSPRNLSREAIG